MKRLVERAPRVLKDKIGRTTGARIGKKLIRRVLISDFGEEGEFPTMITALALTPKSSYRYFPKGKWSDGNGVAADPKKRVVRASANIFGPLELHQPARILGFGSIAKDWESASMIIAEALEMVCELGAMEIEGELRRPNITPDLFEEQTKQIIETLKRWNEQYGFQSTQTSEHTWIYYLDSNGLNARRWQRFLLKIDE